MTHSENEVKTLSLLPCDLLELVREPIVFVALVLEILHSLEVLALLIHQL